MNSSNTKTIGNTSIIVWLGIIFSITCIGIVCVSACVFTLFIGTEYIPGLFEHTNINSDQNNLSKHFTVKYLGSHLSYATYQITNNSGVDVWTTSYQDPDNGCSVKSTYYSFEETRTVSQLFDGKTISLVCKEDITSIDFYLDWAKSKTISIPLQH